MGSVVLGGKRKLTVIPALLTRTETGSSKDSATVLNMASTCANRLTCRYICSCLHPHKGKLRTKSATVPHLILLGGIRLDGDSLDAHGSGLLGDSLGGVLGTSVIDDDVASTER
jgi:hypothetical protein